jgi:hypothetical protein
MSMLSISVTHFVHETEEAVGMQGMGLAWPGQKTTLRMMSDKFKKAAISNILLAAGSNPGRAQGMSHWSCPFSLLTVLSHSTALAAVPNRYHRL